MSIQRHLMGACAVLGLMATAHAQGVSAQADQVRINATSDAPSSASAAAGSRCETAIQEFIRTMRRTPAVYQGRTHQDTALGAVKDAVVCVPPQGRVSVKKAEGHVVLVSEAQGDIQVHDGQASFLLVLAAGQSQVSFLGDAEAARLVASGQSSIVVGNVASKPRIESSGQSTVKILR